MTYEYEGKTEKEAIDNAVSSLGLAREEIDIEIIEEKKSGFFFGEGKVKIRVHTSDNGNIKEKKSGIKSESDIEKNLIKFLSTIIEKMGINCNISIISKEDNRLVLDIQSENAALLIGKRGKTLDSFQILLNVYAGKISGNSLKVIVDSENYRKHQERSLIQLARNVGEEVIRSRKSVLLQPMNPFERRLVHTTLTSYENIETISEGEGLYKKVRIIYKGTEK